MVPKKVMGALPYRALFLPAGPRAKKTPIDMNRSERPKVPSEIPSALLISGIRATNVPAVKPLTTNARVTPIRARRRLSSISCPLISCEAYPAKVEFRLKKLSGKSESVPP